MHRGRVKGEKVKSKKEVIHNLLNTIEHDLKLFIDSNQMDKNSLEISSANLPSISLSWLIHYSKNVLPTQKYEILNLGFIEDENFYGSLMSKLYKVKESLLVNFDDGLNKVYIACVDFNLFYINSYSIKSFKEKCNNLKNDIELINDNFKKQKKEEDDLFEFFIKNINVLLMMENILRVIDKKLSSHNLENDFGKELKGVLKGALNIFDYSDNNKLLLAVDFTRFDMVEEFSIDVDDYFDDDIEKLIENKELLQFISNFIKSFESNLSLSENVIYNKNTKYLKALRIYEVEKKLINKDLEINDLKLKLSGLSMIDKSLTDKNEFYNKIIVNLLDIEDGFNLVLEYYNNLSIDGFTTKEWSEVDLVRNNLKYIVNCFKVKKIYQYLLLLDDAYVEKLLKYFNDQMIGDVGINWEDEKSQEIIKDFHGKMINPENFIKLKREEWNTPLFLFNLNYYTAIKDYKKKYQKIESLDKDINNYIKDNGDFKKKYEDYIQQISNKTQKARQTVSNIVCQYNQVSVLLSNVEKSESFIKEIEGLYINNETRKVYQTVFNEELKVANRFRTVSLFIYGFLGVVAFISLCVLLFASSTSDYLTRLTDIDTLLVKLSLILTLVFIGVYLSREGEKHRRIANQARQTMNELHAFSSYSTDIKDKIPEIKTKLADKYFGKNLYETEKAMTPDSDVLKSVIDQAKATTDLVKAFKGTISPTTSSQTETSDNPDKTK